MVIVIFKSKMGKTVCLKFFGTDHICSISRILQANCHLARNDFYGRIEPLYFLNQGLYTEETSSHGHRI